jgi:hypothetical protein
MADPAITEVQLLSSIRVSRPPADVQFLGRGSARDGESERCNQCEVVYFARSHLPSQ